MGFRISVTALIAGALLNAPGWADCPDDFSGASLAPQWRFVDLDGSAASGGYALAGGKLELTGRGRDAYGAVNEFVGVARTDIAGDFDVSVKLESQSNTHAWAQAGILAATDLGDLSKGGYVVLDATPANGVNLFYDAAAPAGTLDRFSQVKPAGNPPAYPVWLRLAKSGSRFSAWFRLREADAWTPIASNVAPVGAAAPSQLALVSLSHDAAVDGKAVFDDFACLHVPARIRTDAARFRAGSAVARALPGARDAAGRDRPGAVLFRRP